MPSADLTTLWPLLREPVCSVDAHVPDLDAQIPEVYLTRYPAALPEHDEVPDTLVLHQFVLELPDPAVIRPLRAADAQLDRILRGAELATLSAYGCVHVQYAPALSAANEIDALMIAKPVSTVGVVSDGGTSVIGLCTNHGFPRTGIVVTLAAVDQGDPGPVHLYASALHGLYCNWLIRAYPDVRVRQRRDPWPLPAGPFEPPMFLDMVLAWRRYRLAVIDVQPGYWPEPPYDIEAAQARACAALQDAQDLDFL